MLLKHMGNDDLKVWFPSTSKKCFKKLLYGVFNLDANCTSKYVKKQEKSISMTFEGPFAHQDELTGQSGLVYVWYIKLAPHINNRYIYSYYCISIIWWYVCLIS
jgi:hypothetical protein